MAEPLPGGLTKILIAIADVDAIVKPGSPIDRHAYANTTSVYTAAKIFPMLPERLSTDLTSLSEGEDRLALVIEMAIAVDGSVARSDVYRAIVCNRAKLAYRSVAAWLDGSAETRTESRGSKAWRTTCDCRIASRSSCDPFATCTGPWILKRLNRRRS